MGEVGGIGAGERVKEKGRVSCYMDQSADRVNHCVQKDTEGAYEKRIPGTLCCSEPRQLKPQS